MTTKMQFKLKINIVTLLLISSFSLFALANPNINAYAKFRSAPTNMAIENNYIVVLKEAYMDEEYKNNSVTAAVRKQLRNKRLEQAVSDMRVRLKGKIRHYYNSKLGGFALEMDAQHLDEMLKDPRVEYIEQDQLVYGNDIQVDAPWGLDRIDQQDLPLNFEYQYTYTGDGVTAYIVDSGIQASHPEFSGRVLPGLDVIDDGYDTDDCHGHGTHVAGTVGGTTYGVAKEVDLVPVRVLACDGFGSNSGIIAALNWIEENAVKPAVVNMSIGGGGSDAYTAALTSLVESGVTVVAAAGNNNEDACSYAPSGIPAALTVAASTSDDSRASFSNYGDCVDLFAPGFSILSASIYGGASYKNGTSMAAPHVAGAVALYLDKYPDAAPGEIESVIEENAVTNKITDVGGAPNLLLQTDFLNSIESSSLFIASASDWEGSENGYPASKTIDDSLNWESRWQAAGGPVNLVLDLGSPQQLDSVGISWGRGGELTYNFEIWARASSSDEWVKVRSRGDTSGSSSSIENYDVSNMSARYVRIKTHSNSSGIDETVIKEVQIFGYSDMSALAIDRVFDDGTAAAQYPASNVIDGSFDWGSRWAASWASDDNPWVNITLELDQPEPITRLAVSWGRGDQYIYTYEVYAREGTSGEWAKIADSISNGETSQYELFDVERVVAQQIRIKSLGSSLGDAWTNIQEVKVFGTAEN